MNYKTVLTSSVFLKIIFVASLFILIFISGVSYNHTIVLTESSELVVHSYKVRIELDQLYSCIKDAEVGQNSFIISRDSIFLRSFNEAREKVSKSFIELIKLIGDKKQQRDNLDSLYQLISLRLGQLVNSLEQISKEPTNKIQVDNSMLKGRDMMDKIRMQINEMISSEEHYLVKQQKNYKYETLFTPFFTLLILLFSLTVFSFSYYKINHDFERLKESNDNLIITSESIKHAEKIGDFSTWQWNLESDRLIYSDNQYRLLGCEPQSFEPSLRKYLDFVHPNDRHIYTESNDQLVQDKKPITAFYRIIRQDGELRYFKSIGKLLTDIQGKKIVIGINCDVTEQHLSSIALRERNFELERSNKELASFNHIASHDLQEPLRKVQTFISRISEEELSAMSEGGREYLIKIQTAVSRMRILIDDLLWFSRTNKAEKIFEKTDLNLLLENSKQELAQTIDEKKAIIQAKYLPILNVIPFQIQQLFINLISNSLKYSKPGVDPFIQIEYETVNAKDYPILKENSDTKFCKISVTDNGLGFEQEYAESIFTLFYRLHHVTEYPGTGIGLAICKKIIENHSGAIESEGRPGIGSTFSFYLPV